MRYGIAGLLIALGIAFLSGVGCNSQKQSPQDLREKTAETTATLKTDAKAVAQGVREGWNRDHPLDLNSASKAQLMALPMTAEQADRVIAGRPYNSPHDLVDKHILRQTEYDKVADRVTVKK